MKTEIFRAIFLLYILFGGNWTAEAATAGKSGPGGVSPHPPAAWEPWASRPELMPETEFEDGRWRIASDGSPSCQGGWELQWTDVKPGQWYEFSAKCQATGVPRIHDNVHAEIHWWKADGKRADWAHVRFARGDTEDTIRFNLVDRAPDNATSATLRVMLRWTDRGALTWSEPALTAVPAPQPRKFKTAIATGKFPGESIAANLDFALDLVRRAANQGAEVVCLPECITTWRVKEEEKMLGARPIPGIETDALCAEAKRRGIDIVCSLNESEGDLIYNTGLYIDAEDGIVGKYRKVHLSVGERWRGVTPGDEFPVWKTDHGRAGMLICYDNVHAEGHRILAQKGAEVLYLPIMGDPRAVGDEAFENWKRIMQVRAMDNHVWFVVCQNKGEWGLIVRPDGTVAAEVHPENGIAIAELDLGMRWDSWIGSDFENRNWGERRPHLYEEIVEDR